MKRLCRLLLWLMLLIIPLSAMARQEIVLTDDEITQTLRKMMEDENYDPDFMVLPQDYHCPLTGMDGVYKLLILGIDTNNKDLKGRSDTMMIAFLDQNKNQLKLVSFMRDIYVQIPGKGHNKLNAAYAFGGAELVRKTIDNIYGIKVDGYIAVNFSTMCTLVDAIGGIKIDVKENELKPLNGILEYYNYLRGTPSKEGRLEQSGYQTLSGLQTMSYARIRKIDSDYQRIGRQQNVMKAIYEQISHMDAKLLLDLIFRYIQEVGTDITIQEVLELYNTTRDMKEIAVTTLRIPVQDSWKSTMLHDTYFIVQNDQKNRKAIFDFLIQ